MEQPMSQLGQHYQHRWFKSEEEVGEKIDLPVGKVVCVGRNYAAHAKELNNPVPKEPLLFMKPGTSLVPLRNPIVIPKDRGACHFETEVALLVGRRATDIDESEALTVISGVGLALDLTLRDLQSQLKEKGHPWEIAKAFDGACPVTEFLPLESPLTAEECETLGLTLSLNDQCQQQGQVSGMITAIPRLIAYMSRCFTLEAGDIILTGTPEGVGPLQSGQHLILSLHQRSECCLKISTWVA